MKQFSTLLGICLLSGTQLFAQSPSRITGKVKSNSGKPLQGTTVALLQAADSSLVKTELTDKDGNYELLPATGGTYLTRYSAVGYTTTYSGPLTLATGQAVDNGTTTLPTAEAELKEVAIVAKKPLVEVKADKIVFNVENSINATGSNAMELLQKSPGVMVDNNDNISMKGKTGVRVYIDGKMMQLDTKDLAAYLKSINSNDIESIEMISNPGARYDASGNAGIVNIKLKKNKKYGTNGNVSLGYIQGITPKGNGSVALNYRNKKVNVFGNISSNAGTNENGLNLNRTQGDTIFDQRSINKNINNSINVKAGADYFINSRSTIGVLATTGYTDAEFKSESNTGIYAAGTGEFIKTLKAYNNIPGSRMNNNFNINYKYADTNGLEINVDGDYGFFRGTGRSLQPNYYYGANNYLLATVINRNYTPTDIDIYTIKADAEQKLGKGKLGYGAKYANVTTQNTFDFFNVQNGLDVKQLDRSNTFKYTENVNAAYVNYNTPLGKALSLQAGVRVENTHSKGELTRADGIVQADNTVERDYTNLFPSAALTWNINQKHSLNLAGSRRIDRPTYQDLNPFENKMDELTYQKGNAFLRPQYTTTMELTHTFMSYVNTSVSYSHVTDFATEVTDTLRSATYIQQRNLATQDIYNISIGTPIPVNKWWMGYANVWYSYQVFNGQINQNKVNVAIPLYGAYMQQTFTLGHNYTAEVSGWYNGPAIWGGTWRTSHQGGLDLGLQKQFWNKNATFKLAVTDIFYTAPWKATNDFGGLKIRGNGNWESRTFRASFSYRFGSNQVNSARKRETGLESEKNRIKG